MPNITPAEVDSLVALFERKTGCCTLGHASLRFHGEPVALTPFDAYRCFMRREIDVLALGNCMLIKKDQPPWHLAERTDS